MELTQEQELEQIPDRPSEFSTLDADIYFLDYDDDVRDSMAQDVGSSSNSPDVEQQDKFDATFEGEVGEVPGGNVAMSRLRPRFRHTNA